MSLDFATAAAAYGKTGIGATGLESRQKSGSGFADMLGGFIKENIDNLKHAEQSSLKGLQGKADLTDVITAIGKAELSLQAVVTVRDRVISGYQEIMRMPI